MAIRPLCKCHIENDIIDVLRDTGCSGVVIKDKFVYKDHYTGKYSCMMMINKTVVKVPMALIYVDTPNLVGEVEALCLPDSMYDLLIGNIEGPKNLDKPNNERCIDACAIQQPEPDVLNITRTEIIQMQTQDETINNLHVDKPSQFVKKKMFFFSEYFQIMMTLNK